MPPVLPGAPWQLRRRGSRAASAPAPLVPYAGKAQVLVAWGTVPFAPNPAWTDVSSFVRFEASISMQRGRQDNISQIQAGRLTLTLDNSDGRFTVGLSSSPYYPNVKIGRRIQVNVPDENGVLHTRFDGLITELPAEWTSSIGLENLAVIQASDILSWLGRQDPLLSWTQQEMLADNPVALWSLADTSSVTSAADQAGQGAQPLQVVSQGDGTGAAAAGSGVPLAEIITSGTTAQQQQVQTYTFTTPGAFSVTFPAGTLVSCDVQAWGGGQAGVNGTALTTGGAGGKGAEFAREQALAVTPGLTYTGTVGAVGVPSGGNGGDTTFAGDSVTVTAHGGGSGSTSSNSVHFAGGSGGAGQGSSPFKGGGGGSSGGLYQAGYNGLTGANGGAAGSAVTGGGAGGAGDTANTGGNPGSAPGGGGGGGSAPTSGGAGGAGQVIITYTYVPPATSNQNSSIPSWLFTPSATLAARVLTGPLPQAVTAAAGFAFECWAAFAGIPSAAVTTVTTPGPVTFTAPPGAVTADVQCQAAGSAGVTGTPATTGGAGGNGGEYAEEPALAITPDSSYAGTVGAPGAPSGGTGGNTTFTGDAVTVTANGSGSGSSNTTHFSGGSGGAGQGSTPFKGGGGGSSASPYQAGNNGLTGANGGAAGSAVTGGGAGGAGDTANTGAGSGSAPGGGGGGGSAATVGGAGGAGQMVITCQPANTALLTLSNPRTQFAIAVWVNSTGHLQLASTSGYGTRNPSWTTVDAGVVTSSAFHVAVSVAATTRVATLYVNGAVKGTLTLPAGASYAQATIGGAYGSWLGGWNGSAGLLAVYPAALSSARVGVHYSTGNTAFAGSSTGTMIGRIAAYTGLPSFWYTAPSGIADPSYGQGLVSYLDLKGQNPLAAMQAYEQAEGGVLSVNAAGRLTFADRASRQSAGAAGSAFTLTSDQYQADTSFKSNDQYLATEACYATVNLPGGYPVTNPAASADYGPYVQNSGSPSSPQTAPFADAAATAGTYSTDDLMDAGNWQVGVNGQPTPRIPSLTVDLLTLPASELSPAAFYGLDIGSAVQLSGLPAQAPDSSSAYGSGYGSGYGITYAGLPACVIEGVNETIGVDAHTVQLYTSPLSQNAAWIPGDPLLGVIGSTTTIGRSASPAMLGAPYTPVAVAGPGLNRTGAVGAEDMRTFTVNVQNRLTPPLLIAQQASAQTLTTLAGQAVSFDTLAADTAAGMGTTTTYTIPAGYAGYYWCAAVVQAATGTASLGGVAAWFSVTLSGVTSHWHARSLPYLSSAPYTAVSIAGRIGPCSAGDTIQVMAAAAGTPASLPLGTADGGSMFTLIWQGA